MTYYIHDKEVNMLRNITRPTANRTTLANRSTLKTLTKSMLA